MNRIEARGLVAALAAAGAFTGAAVAADHDCLIEPAQVVEVRSPVVGLLQEVPVRRGQAIRKGQTLVVIESSVERSQAETASFRAQAQGAVLEARGKAEAAREKARRMEELLAEEFVSAQARDDAVAELHQAEAELQTAQENVELARLQQQEAVDQLNRRVVRSPFDGVVMDQYLYPGALVDAGDNKKPIIKIAQIDPLVVQAILPFTLFPQVHAGDRVTVLPEPPFEGQISTRVKTVDRVIDSAAGTFGVVLELPNARHQLPGGIRCKLRLKSGL
ncbi:MAG TPA: efflux RND transporter periplasmic adaptor subunit [Burkholderiaceae bacterium]